MSLLEDLMECKPYTLADLDMDNPRTRTVARVPGCEEVREQVRFDREGGKYTGWCVAIKTLTGSCPDNLDRDGRDCDHCFCG